MIPARLIRAWFGGAIPHELAAYGETWRKHHPDWEMQLWTENQLSTLQNQDLFDAAEEISPQAPNQLRGDIVRYELLYRYGGVWIDCDFECLQPIDHLLQHEAFMAWVVPGRWVNNAIMGFPAGHPFLAEVIDKLPENARRHPKIEGNAQKSGPQFITPIVLRYPSVTLLPAELLYPYRWDELDRASDDFSGALAVHRWWNRSRRRAAKPSRRQTMDHAAGYIR